MIFWLEPVAPDLVVVTWLIRIFVPLAALFTAVKIIRPTYDPLLNEKLAVLMPAGDLICPFCNVPMMLGAESSCPSCGALRC
jgi:hypothetical protein